MRRKCNVSAAGHDAMSKNGKLQSAQRKLNGFYSSANQSRRRKDQLATEENTAEKMRADGYAVFSPTVVCDRIAVKNGKVYFVEFKKPGQALRAGQQAIRDLVPSRYLVKAYAD
jgi:hypothetical protein